MSSSIIEIIRLVKSGVSIKDAIPEGSDLKLWQRIVDNYNPDAKPKRKRSRAERSSQSRKRSNYAEQVLDRGRAMAELVKRVNGPIPFDGEPIPYESEADDYGLQPAF